MTGWSTLDGSPLDQLDPRFPIHLTSRPAVFWNLATHWGDVNFADYLTRHAIEQDRVVEERFVMPIADTITDMKAIEVAPGDRIQPTAVAFVDPGSTRIELTYTVVPEEHDWDDETKVASFLSDVMTEEPPIPRWKLIARIRSVLNRKLQDED